MSADRIWIIDGHNVIFALGALKVLQLSQRGGEARALLVERLEAFAHERGQKVLVVFDGADATASDPESLRRPLLEVVFSRRGEGAADERILREAARLARRGTLVTVVTNDMATLAHALPREVRHLRVREFWLSHVEPPRAADEKPAGGNFSDIERDMLALAAAVAAESGGRGSAPAPDPPPAAEGRRLDKKERGRRRQKRRLIRRAKRV